MEFHSAVFLGIGIVAFAYWLKAVDFLPHRRAPQAVRNDREIGLNQNW